MRVVVALGGNALLERGEKPEARIEHRHVRRAAASLAPLAADHELVICHGNGPQIGLLALESESDPDLERPYPLDALGAQTQGLIGYWLAQELHNAGVVHPLATVVTQTVVAEDDPAFAEPSKFIGRVYDRREGHRLGETRGWTVKPDGASWRRVVPSPDPQRFVELPAIRTLLAAGFVVVCGGGGGAPVIENESGQLVGVEAVVDKDLTAAALARELQADALLLLTDVPAVMRGFSTAHPSRIDRISTEELAAMQFPAGSMGPKVEGCRRFVEATGGRAAIGALADAADVLAGRAGTTIVAAAVAAGPMHPGR
jgi:carbamate kinase